MNSPAHGDIPISQRRAEETYLCLDRLTAREIDDPFVNRSIPPRIVSDDSQTAIRVGELAAAWRRYPGIAAYRKRMRVQAPRRGAKAGEQLWNAALGGKAEDELTRLVSNMRGELGPAVGTSRYDESEVGIREFFWQLQLALGAYEQEIMNGSGSTTESRRGVPDPAPHAIIDGYEELKRMGPVDRVTAQHVFQLYELHKYSGIELQHTTDSSKYVQRSGQDRRPHQLPRPPSAGAGVQRRNRGRFASGAEWSAPELMAAFEGWAERLGMELERPESPF